MIVGLATLFLHEPLTRGKMVALALAFTGVSLIAYPGLTGRQA